MKRTLLDPLYRQRVDMCDTKEDWLKAANKRCRQAKLEQYPPDTAKDASGLSAEVDGALILGVFDDDLSTLAHECVHLAVSTLRLRAIPITAKNEEALAYLVGWYFQAWQRRMK